MGGEQGCQELAQWGKHPGAQRLPPRPTYAESRDKSWRSARNTPALVADLFSVGTDHVVSRCHGYGEYPALLAPSGLTLAMAAAAPVCVRRARQHRGARTGMVTSGGHLARFRFWLRRSGRW